MLNVIVLQNEKYYFLPPQSSVAHHNQEYINQLCLFPLAFPPAIDHWETSLLQYMSNVKQCSDDAISLPMIPLIMHRKFPAALHMCVFLLLFLAMAAKYCQRIESALGYSIIALVTRFTVPIKQARLPAIKAVTTYVWSSVYCENIIHRVDLFYFEWECCTTNYNCVIHYLLVYSLSCTLAA